MKKLRKNLAVLLVVLIGSLVLTMVSYAGDLEPPSAPAPTMKTLDEIEPRIPIPASATPTGLFTISQSGSYYLEGDRNCSGRGIQILVDDVTIDLMGYALKGPGAGANIEGIYMSSRNNIEIRNGTIRSFNRGIFGTGTPQNLRVINIRSLSNASAGIYLSGSNHLVKDCIVSGNGYDSPTAFPYGINVGNSSAVIDNMVDNTGYAANSSVYGINASAESIITGNISNNNGGGASNTSNYYVHGIRASDKCMVTNNTASNNGTSVGGQYYQVYGIRTGIGCTVTGNTASSNGTSIDGGGGDVGYIYGINAGNGSTITGNTACHNGKSTVSYTSIYGIYAGGSSTIRSNTAYQNGQLASANSIAGIYTYNSAVISNTANYNGNGTMGIGVYLGNDSFVDQNIAYGNFGTNMNVPASGLVTANNYAP